MKIKIIDPSLFTWPYDNALANGIKDNGHDVTLYAKHLATGDQGKTDPLLAEFFYPGFQKPWVKNLPKKLFLGLKGLAHIASMTALLIHLKKEKPDAIHFQWTPLAVVDKFFIPHFRKIAPTILTVHDSSPFNNNPSAALQRIGAIEIINQFDALIVHTGQARNALIRYGIDAGKITIIPHGVLDAPKVEMDATPDQNPDKDTIDLLLFGQVKPYKGTDIIINALALLPDTLKSKVKLHVVGRPQMDMEPLFALAKEKNVEHQINWDLRFIDDAEIPAIFTAADIMVMPYREIDASGVLMVSLAVGRPIIASKIGLFKELLEDGQHGILTEPDNPQNLAQAITTLAENKELRKKMGENVLQLGKDIPDWTEIGKRTIDLYQSIKT